MLKHILVRILCLGRIYLHMFEVQHHTWKDKLIAHGQNYQKMQCSQPACKECPDG